MQHLAHQLARRGSLQNRISSMHDEAFVHPSNQALLRTTRAILEQPMQEARQTYNHSTEAASHSHSNNGIGSHGAERYAQFAKLIQCIPLPLHTVTYST